MKLTKIFSFSKRVLKGFAILATLLSAGCITLEKQEATFPTEGPVFLRPAARELHGARTEDLVVETKNTVAKMPLHTQLIRQVAEKAKKGVVSIYVKTATPARVRLLPIPIPGLGLPVRLPGTGLGSGFFIHPTGYLLTNNHVIKDAVDIRVLTSDGADFGVIVVARYPVFDLALLKIQGSEREFPVVPMGDSEAVGVGDIVIAVGNPLGLGHTVTSGIISQTGRNLSGVLDKDKAARQIQFIQTDTAINPGSSGGPLVTLTCAWVGVNTAGVTEAQGIGFAVPSNQIREFLDQIRAGKGQQEAGTR
jgi:S1-C subfamily serine protease